MATGTVKLLHYGLQRSGTNYLEALLAKNFRVRFLNSNSSRSSPLQKHCRFYDQKDIVPQAEYRNAIVVNNFRQFEELFDVVPDYYLIISKDPYSWYLSYRSWAQQCGWPSVTHHYIEEYNLYYGKFLELSLATEKILFVRYVELLTNRRAVLNALAVRMNLEKRFLSRFRTWSPRLVAQSTSFSGDRRDFYIGEEFLRAFSEEELRVLNGVLDVRVASLLGYQRRDS